MKKVLSILIALCLCVSSSYAQYARHHRVERPHYHSGWDKFDRTLHTIDNVASTAYLLAGIAHLDNYTGIRVGANTASLKLDGNIDHNAVSDNIGGMDLGMVFGWYLGRSPLILEPGVFLSLKGGELSASHDIATKYHMTMIEIPLVVKADIPLGSNSALQPYVGGFISFGVGGESDFKDEHASYDTFANDGFKSFDAGLRAGLGLAVNHFYVEIVSDFGLTNLAASRFEDFGYDDWSDEINSRCVSFNIGVNF